LVTLENWNDLMHAALRSSQSMILSLTYLIVWIFIGNYIFLNLFLSILLDGFENKEQEDDVKELEKE
jgi:Ion transport protein